MATLKLQIGLDSLDNETKDGLIAPKISEITTPKIPDIRPKRKDPLSVFILNFQLSLTISNKTRQLLFNTLRRVQDAFDEYCEGRENILSFAQSDKKSVSSYFASLRSFENCLGHVYQVVRCMNSLEKPFGSSQQFDKGDGSILDRVNTLHTAIKHMDNRFEEGSCPDEISFKTLAGKPGKTKAEKLVAPNIPVWLTDDALESRCARVTYEELSQEILEILENVRPLARIQPKSKNS